MAFGLFRKNRFPSGKSVSFCDFDGNEIKEGDIVLSPRYDLGECRIMKVQQGIVYKSLADSRTVSWTKMIDAGTGYQKVRKLES